MWKRKSGREKLVEEYKGFKIYRVTNTGWMPEWIVKDDKDEVVMEYFACKTWTLEKMKKQIDKGR